MSPLRPRVRDDRGRKVSLPLKRAIAQDRRIAWHERGVDFSRKEAAVQALVLLGVLIPMILLARPLAEAIGALAAFIVNGVVAAATIAVLLRVIAGMRARKVVARCLNERKCPACSYSLAGIAPEPDGCTVCPECGAAWRLTARCLVCGTSLAEMDRESDGCLVCPQCRTAWRERKEGAVAKRRDDGAAAVGE